MSFDRLAPHYRWMEAVLAGGALHRCRTRWLTEVRDARRVLLAGEGNGRMLLACAQVLPESEFVVLDQSEAMLIQARRNWEQTVAGQRVTFQQADLRTWQGTDGGFDLVVTNFFLDCFTPEELRSVVANLGAAASRNARWLLADFVVPSAGWRRWRAQMVLALAYGFFRLTTGITARRIADPVNDLTAAGFSLQHRERFNQGLLQADLWRRVV